MATRSMVGIWNPENGTVIASYIHWDGYVDGVGSVLVRNYNTQELANMVATGGYLSSLEETYEQSRADPVRAGPAVRYTSVEDYLENSFNYSGAEYIYLFDGDAWFFATYDNRLFEEVEINLGLAA